MLSLPRIKYMNDGLTAKLDRESHARGDLFSCPSGEKSGYETQARLRSSVISTAWLRPGLLAVCLFLHAAAVAAAEPATVNERAEALLAQMTLGEKISQLTLSTGYGAVTGPIGLQQSLEEEIRQGDCGNVFNVLSVAQVSKLQKIAV